MLASSSAPGHGIRLISRARVCRFNADDGNYHLHHHLAPRRQLLARRRQLVGMEVRGAARRRPRLVRAARGLTPADLIERSVSRLGNRSAEVTSCLDPQIDGLLGLRHGFRGRRTVRHAPRQFRYVDDEGVVLRTPEHDQLVFMRHIQGFQAEIVLHDQPSHLTHLVGLGLVAVSLEVEDSSTPVALKMWWCARRNPGLVAARRVP